MDYHNQEDFTDRNTIIYGHNMRDGSMFGTLEKYQDPGVYDVYPKFYVYVPGYVYEYHIFSCYAAPVNNAAYTYSFPDVKDYQDFLGVMCCACGKIRTRAKKNVCRSVQDRSFPEKENAS